MRFGVRQMAGRPACHSVRPGSGYRKKMRSFKQLLLSAVLFTFASGWCHDSGRGVADSVVVLDDLFYAAHSLE